MRIAGRKRMGRVHAKVRVGEEKNLKSAVRSVGPLLMKCATYGTIATKTRKRINLIQRRSKRKPNGRR